MLTELLNKIDSLDDDIQYLIETKDDVGLSETKAILEAAKQKAVLVIGAISRRKDLLDAEHLKIFESITG